MAGEIEEKRDKRAKFLNIFADIPERLRGDIIAVVDKKPYTWNTAYLEIKNNTPLGREILKSLEATRLV
ncbi:MAG: hypothetical protein V1886_00060 [archaeon]